MIFAAFTGRVTPSRCAIRYMAGWEVTMSGLTPDGDTRLQAARYEAGPTGFGLARHLLRLGVACEVIAPGLIPHRATDHVKTDRRDARKLAEDLRPASLTAVHLPSEDEEAFRDLVRARETTVEDRRRFRLRIQSA